MQLNQNKPNTRARGLNLVGHDRDLGADHAVQKRGFARVGLSYEGDETGALGHLERS